MDISYLDDDALGLVLRETRAYKPALVGVCRHWAARASFHNKADVLRPSDLAERGHLSLLRELGVLWPFALDIARAEILRGGALGGHWDVCELAAPELFSEGFAAKESSSDPERRLASEILRGAASGGHIELLRAAHPIVALAIPEGFLPAYKEALRGAVRGGHVAVCDCLLDWGTPLGGPGQDGRDSRWGLLVAAARHDGETRPHGHKMLKWMKRYYDGYSAMLEAVALCGSERLCRLVREWAKEDHGIPVSMVLNYDMMIEFAAKGGHEHICRLGIEWGAAGPAPWSGC